MNGLRWGILIVPALMIPSAISVVGDVPQDRVLVPHTERQQGIVEFAHPLRVELVDPLAAVGRHQFQLLQIGFDHLGDEIAALLL